MQDKVPKNVRRKKHLKLISSGRGGYLGAAVVAIDDNLEIAECEQVQVCLMGSWFVHVAELIGIFYAVGIVFNIAH
jgi:hypothetical protein